MSAKLKNKAHFRAKCHLFESPVHPCSPMALAATTLDTPKVARASATTGMILRLTTSIPRAVRGSQRYWMYSVTVGTAREGETGKEGERIHGET